MAVESRGDSLIAASWSLFSVATLFLLLRAYTTFFLLRGQANFFAKAATICAAVAWTIGLLNSIFTQISADNGMGRHLIDIPLSTRPKALLFSWLADAMSRLSVATGKVAVVLFLCALQNGVQKKWQKGLLAFIAVSNICFSIVIVFTIMFQCSPPKKLWYLDIPGECNVRVVNNRYGFFIVSWGAASDLTLALYPTYLFSSLQMDRKLKVTMSILCGMGVFAAACACVTCYQLQVVTNSTDPTWITVPLKQWGYTEMWVVIMAACIPPVMPYFKRVVLPRMSSGMGSKSGSNIGSKIASATRSKNRDSSQCQEERLEQAKSDQLELTAIDEYATDEYISNGEAISLESERRRSTPIVEHV